MILLSEDLVNEFYENNKDKYPEISRKQAKDICYGPWKFLKEQMENGELETVRFKYFGSFQIYKGRAAHLLNSLDERFEKKLITEKDYIRIKEMLNKFISKNADNS